MTSRFPTVSCTVTLHSALYKPTVFVFLGLMKIFFNLRSYVQTSLEQIRGNSGLRNQKNI